MPYGIKTKLNKRGVKYKKSAQQQYFSHSCHSERSEESMILLKQESTPKKNNHKYLHNINYVKLLYNKK